MIPRLFSVSASVFEKEWNAPSIEKLTVLANSPDYP